MGRLREGNWREELLMVVAFTGSGVRESRQEEAEEDNARREEAIYVL